MTRSALRVAVVAGASGLVGRELLQRLLRVPAYARVVALARRALNLGDRVVEAPARFDALDDVLADAVPPGATLDAYCCLGTTLRIAKSQAAFRQVDFGYVVAFGEWAARHNARRLIVISALGADASSRVFYNRVKGEAEQALRDVAGPKLVVLRPSLLDGARAEFRAGEWLALALSRPLRRLLPDAVRPVRIADVAQSMIDAAFSKDPPAVIESASLHGAAARGDLSHVG